MNKFNCIFIVIGLASALGLGGCVSMQASTNIPAQKARQVGLTVSDKMPVTLPSDAQVIPDTHFAVVFAENAATLLMPIPFVGEAVEDSVNSSKSKSYRDHYLGLDVVGFARDALAKSSLASDSAGAMQIHPVAYVQECIDEKFRISLAIHIESPDWTGRYLYHVPTSIPAEDISNPTEQELSQMKNEFKIGFSKLVELIERDANGQLQPTGQKVDFGSLYLYGSRLGGLVSPYMMHLSDGELIEEGKDYVIFRHSGDMSVAGNAGAMLFGVHYFMKDQLHTLEVIAQ
ncbi:hypothetical protein [Neptunicella sp.]|uniref:hypothetical protein n=1 Tax=Neptunicella sp. TaxID=2125986 RepID=UPI003F693586